MLPCNKSCNNLISGGFFLIASCKSFIFFSIASIATYEPCYKHVYIYYITISRCVLMYEAMNRLQNCLIEDIKGSS